MEPEKSDERDPMGPPEEPCECFCLHCKRIFMSDQMWFQRVINAKDGFPGFWLCPTPNCGGAGFCMDIFPTDPNHPANAGWHSSDESEDEEGGEEGGDEKEWDPSEPEFSDEFEEEYADEDIEGDEWKHGQPPDQALIPSANEPLEESPAMKSARLEREEEERSYDMPDERPRVLDWANQKDPPPPVDGDDAILF